MIYRFGAFELDEEAGELRRSGEPVRIQPKPLALLTLLVRESGRVVSQGELFEALWPGTAVTPSSLTRAVSHARRAIGDTHKGERIRSVPRRGYRFGGDVAVASGAPVRISEPGPARRGAASGLASVFVGREDAFAVMHEVWSQVGEGRGAVVLVSGPAGIGKTRLVEVFGDRIGALGPPVIFGACRDGEGVPAFWLWAQVLRRLSSLGWLSPEPSWEALLSGAGAPEDESSRDLSAEQRFHFFDSVSRALKKMVVERPLVLVLEDLQWAGSPSLRMLEHLAFELRETRLMIIGTVRSEIRERGHPIHRTLSILRKHPSCSNIDLGGLSRAEVGSMLTDVIGRPPPAELTSELFASTEGVPLFLREAVRLLAERGDLERPERIRRRGVTLPRHAVDLIRRALDALSDPCSELVAAGSVLGREFTLSYVAAVARLDRGDALDLLDDAVAAGVLEEAPGAAASYRFTHALFQEAAYEALQAGSRARLHMRAAERLEIQYAEDPSLVIAELAHHHHQAIAIGDPERAFECATRAAEQARHVFAYEQAADHYEQAADALEHFELVDPSKRLAVLLALGEAHRLAGDRARRRSVSEQAMQSARALGWPRAFAEAAIRFCDLSEWSPRDEAAVASVAEALGGLAEDDAKLRARLTARRAYLMMQSSPEKAQPVAREAVGLARRSGDPEALQESLYTLLYAIAGPDHHAERREMIGELCEAARASHSSETTVIAALDIACDCLSVGDRPGAEQMRREVATLSGESPSPGMVWHASVFDTGVALLEGRFDPVEQMARDALLVGQRIDHPFALACYNGQIMQLHRDRGELEEVLALFEPALRSQRSPTHWVKAVIGQTQWQLGNERRARELFEDLAQADFADIGRGIRWIGTIVETAHLCADLGDGAGAETLIRQLTPVEHHHGVLPVPIQYRGPVAHCLARLHESLGLADPARQLYEEALESAEALGARPTLARIQLDAARLLARAGDSEGANRLQKTGSHLASSLGMGGLGSL